MIEIKKPYILFLGDAADHLAAKTARGIFDWRPDDCIGQLRLPDCQTRLELDDVTLEEAKARGAQTLVVGVANRGGVVSPTWTSILLEALDTGFDLAAGLHQKLADIPEIADRAHNLGRKIFDVRHPYGKLSVGTGKPRAGKRLLPVGTDCSCGKMYTALSLEQELHARGIKADFRATGQTGILIAGSGMSVDAVPADFISGVIEDMSPDNQIDHWDLIEGQGSLFHPSFAGVSMGLIHGAQPDALVLCHEPTRTHMRGLPDYPIPDLKDCMEMNLKAAQLTNPATRFVGISVNTSAYNDTEAKQYLQTLEETFALPATDPFRYGVKAIVDAL